MKTKKEKLRQLLARKFNREVSHWDLVLAGGTRFGARLKELRADLKEEGEGIVIPKPRCAGPGKYFYMMTTE